MTTNTKVRRKLIRLNRGAIATFLRKYKFELVLITPLLLYVLGFTLLPVIQNVALSFQQHYDGGSFPTLDSYQVLFSKYRFKEAVMENEGIYEFYDSESGGPGEHAAPMFG